MHPNQNPKLDDPALIASLDAKVAQLKADLAAWAAELPAITMANSLGAEDMVLTDVIATNKLPIEIFSLDTGRLPLETYDLIAEVKKHYGLALKLYYPRHELVEEYFTGTPTPLGGVGLDVLARAQAVDTNHVEEVTDLEPQALTA